MTIRDSYPLPIIDNVLAKVGTGKIFSKIDLFSGYWQVPMNEPDIEKLHSALPQAFTSTYTCQWVYETQEQRSNE